MSETTYNVILPEKGVPIKAWTKGVALEDQARQQLVNVAQPMQEFKALDHEVRLHANRYGGPPARPAVLRPACVKGCAQEPNTDVRFDDHIRKYKLLS